MHIGIAADHGGFELKAQQAQGWRCEKNLSYRISVDGGINDQTAAECARAGADTFVAGTSSVHAA
ncbi:MAG: hypothetical protein ACYTXY_36530 [Nostoc sp.]